MVKTRSDLGTLSPLFLTVFLTTPHAVLGETARATPSTAAATTVRPPLIVGVAIDETGITPADLRRSQDLVLAVLDSLPQGSKMTLASFSGDKRIVLPPTADRALLATTLSGFSAGASGVALPDGLFDMVEYLASRDSDARALLLVSTGRVREGDLQFEDPLSAATTAAVPIFALALGQGDGKLLRRIAKVTGGDYVRLEVADAAMLANALTPRSEPRPSLVRERDPPAPATRVQPGNSGGLLGAAAIFFSLGGVMLLGIVVLLVRQLRTPPPKLSPPIESSASAMDSRSRTQVSARADPDDIALERTLVINADPILRALSGPGAGKNFRLSASGPTSIGRSRRNDIVVPEDAASAQHCRIDREGDSYVLHDLGATNGTWINGARTERSVLQHGDRLKVGETVFTVSLFGDRP